MSTDARPRLGELLLLPTDRPRGPLARHLTLLHLLLLVGCGSFLFVVFALMQEATGYSVYGWDDLGIFLLLTWAFGDATAFVLGALLSHFHLTRWRHSGLIPDLLSTPMPPLALGHAVLRPVAFASGLWMALTAIAMLALWQWQTTRDGVSPQVLASPLPLLLLVLDFHLAILSGAWVQCNFTLFAGGHLWPLWALANFLLTQALWGIVLLASFLVVGSSLMGVGPPSFLDFFSLMLLLAVIHWSMRLKLIRACARRFAAIHLPRLEV